MWNTILRAGVVLVELLLTVAYVSKVSVVVIFRVIYTHVTRTIIFLLVMTLLYGSNHLPCHMSLNCTCYDRHEHANWTIILSPVVKRPITANQGSTGFFFKKKGTNIFFLEHPIIRNSREKEYNRIVFLRSHMWSQILHLPRVVSTQLWTRPWAECLKNG